MAPITLPRPLPIVDDQAPGVVAPPERIVAWAKAAREGDKFVYAIRQHLPPGSPGALAVRNLAERGLIFPRRRRHDALASEFVFWMIRTDATWSDPAAPPAKPILTPRRTRAEDAGDYQVAEAIFPILERAAQFGRPCPTDKELARRAHVQPSSVKAGFDALRSMHAITVVAAPAPTLRLVTILASGARTGFAKAGDR